MARTALTVAEARRTGAAVTQSSTVGTLEYKFTFTGKEMILVENNSGTSKTLTLNEASSWVSNTGYADNDVTTIADGAIKIVGPITNSLRWVQTDGMVYFDVSASNASFTLAVIRNPDQSSEATTK